MKRILKILIISAFVIFASNMSFANEYENLTPKVLNTQKNVQQVNLFKDNSEKLYGIIGKTQVIKFDEPIKRISITDPTLADLVLLSPQELLLNGKKSGRTSLVFWGNNDKPIFFNLVVQQDSDALMQAIEQVTPEENLNYVFTDDGVILSGKISSTNVKNQIKGIVEAHNFKLVDLTESPTKQVLLEVKITEASRNFSRSLDSSFSFGDNYGSFIKNTLGISDLLDITNGNLLNGVGQFIYSSSSSKLAWAISAAEKKGNLKILAEPKLLAIDGKPGSFNVGNEIPVPSKMGNYGNIAYEFKETGVILNFTPTILEKSNRVMLKLSPEISEIDSSYVTASGIPSFTTRKVDTTVELASGETLIIAGLLSHSATKTRSYIPWIGEIPVLGLLFGSYDTEKRDTELVIFITPKIVSSDTEATGLEL